MRKLLPVLVLGFLIFQSCKKIPVGFLQTEYASYLPDSLVIKSMLDTTSAIVPNPMYIVFMDYGVTPEQAASFGVFPTIREYVNESEYRKYKFNVPWVSTPIQGLKGTAPIKIEISKIIPETFESNKLRSLIDIRGSSGVLQLPVNHGLSPGKYVLSLRFSNEGWDKELENIFTIIIK